MSGGNIDVDESPELSSKVRSLEALVDGTFSTTLSKLSSASRLIPASRDFHFYNNFDEFKRPIDELAGSSQSVLETIGDSEQVWGKSMTFPGDVEEDDAEDWLCNVNDEFIERFDVSVDDFERFRKKEEEIGRRPLAYYSGDDVFQMVYGRKKKKTVGNVIAAGSAKNTDGGGSMIDVKVAERDKHSSERSKDDQRFMHPLDKFSVTDFVDKDVNEMEPIKLLPLEETPFKFVQEVKELKELVSKLSSVEVFAVDLEHNEYQSSQELTCLMQISTRTEDYIIDTVKLHGDIGPYLSEVFKDPKKKKVMHGADRDIVWLQRDFDIYVYNLFDTEQASRVLKLERNSLEFLLQHFCGFTANKEYQNANWQIRPLPEEMTRYAREGTHYLLYIYDVIRQELQRMAKDDEHTDSPLVEVYKRSYGMCTKLYEKELLTESSYLHVYRMDAHIGGKSRRRNQQAQAKAHSEARKKAESESSSSQSTVQRSFQEILGIVESLIQDWSRPGGKIIDDVIDQKDRDICWAICFARLVQALHNIGLPTDQHLEFSYEELIGHIIPKSVDDLALPNLKKAIKYVAEKGVMKVHINKNAKAGALGKRVTKSLKFYEDVDDSFIQRRLDRYPVALLLEDKAEFQILREEIYYLPKKKSVIKGLHIILLFGYGRTKEGELYFIGQNSYGEGWGCKGYGRIIVRENCDIVCLKEEV